MSIDSLAVGCSTLLSTLVSDITHTHRVEGRSWYTTHRGRLWIAAAAKVPSQPEIDQVEHFYRSLYEGVALCDYYVWQ